MKPQSSKSFISNVGYNISKKLSIFLDTLVTSIINEFYTKPTTKLCDYLFSGIPEHYPLKKKLTIFRVNSKFGDFWDKFQIGIVIITCIIYAFTRYQLSWFATKVAFLIEIVTTQFFMLDFLLNCYLQTSFIHFIMDYMTIIDILTMVPVYVVLITGE